MRAGKIGDDVLRQLHDDRERRRSGIQQVLQQIQGEPGQVLRISPDG
jgi:hypothetical protein